MTDRITTTEYRKLSPARKPKRDYKREFLNQLHLLGLPQPETEVYFARPRRWRADFLWPQERVLCEYNGIFGAANASHASLRGLKRDYEKLTEASLLGYRLILITAETVANGMAVEWVRRALEARS